LEKLVAPVDHKPFSLPDSQVELKAFPVEWGLPLPPDEFS
jgi:hypothetical protein